jgi:hypothetical protein
MAAKADHQHTLVSHDHSTSNKGGQLTATTGLNATGTASSTTYLRGDNTWTAAPTAANATSSTPGLIQLSGSLGGTAAAPTVVTNANLTGDVTSVGNATTLTSSSNVESVISANTTVAGALQKTNNLSDIADAGTSRANIHVPALTPAACVVTTNVATLSGLNTYDGYTLAAGDIVLLTGQTSAIQNGLYTAASGSWTRPTEMATGVVMKARTVAIIQGTNYGGSIFLLRTNTSLTVDTSSQTWVQQLPSSVVNAAGATASYVPVASGNGNYAWQILSSGSGGSNSTSNLGSLGATKTFPSVSAGATVFMYGILTANTTITLPTANAGAAITLELTQNSNGGWVPSFGGVTVTYPLGTPNWLTETNAVNVLELRCFDGSTWQIIPVSSEVAEGTFTYLRVNGITGANTDPMFFAGMTASGAPSSGTFPANTFAFDETGAIFFTATGGSPGTWIQVNSSGGSGSSNVIDGVTISGTPSSGQSIVATSSSAATWQTPSGGSTTVSRASASTALPGNDADSLWLPRYNGFLTWTLPIYVANTTVGTGTNTYLMKTYIPRNMTVNNITLIVTSAGASLTANSCYAGIYNSAGMLIGQTTDQSSSWTSLGTKTMALTSPVSLTGGDDDFVWIAICAAGTTLPSFAGPVNGTTYLNVNVSAANSFGAYITNGMPASFTPSSVTQSTTFRWAALS